ncbi:zinc ribbon domain-containing protein [Janthinobacterium sp. LB2P49]
MHRAILDRGWDEFGQRIAYKREWNGGVLQAAPPYHTNQTCPA